MAVFICLTTMLSGWKIVIKSSCFEKAYSVFSCQAGMSTALCKRPRWKEMNSCCLSQWSKLISSSQKEGMWKEGECLHSPWVIASISCGISHWTPPTLTEAQCSNTHARMINLFHTSGVFFLECQVTFICFNWTRNCTSYKWSVVGALDFIRCTQCKQNYNLIKPLYICK